MARGARGFRVIYLVAIQASVHGSDAGHFGHRGHFRHFAMARFTLHGGFEMWAMGPLNAGQYGVHANPEDRLLRFRILRQLLNGRLVFRDGDVALHALSVVGKVISLPCSGFV